MRVALAPLLFVLLFGCASYTEETREIRSLYKGDSYRAALEKLDASALKDEDKNRLLYRLEKAMILDRLREGAQARKTLLDADKLADELYTTSVSRTAASFLMNDAAADYAGEDYEKVAIHTQLALSFLGDKDLNAARVQALKINNKLHELNQSYDSNKNQYGEDAFARYLAAVIYEAKGETDDAIIDYAKAVQLYQGDFAKFVQGGVPDEAVKALYRLLVKRQRTDRMAQLEKDFPKPVAEAKAEQKDESTYGYVVVVHELGQIAIKTTGEFFFGFGKQLVRFSFPTIQKSSQAYWGRIGITEDKTGKHFGANNVSYMDEIARVTLDDRRLRLIAKQSARLLAKGQLTEQAYKNFGPLGGIAANVFTVVTETADTRSWTLLPESYFISRARLKAGPHDLKFETGGKITDVVKVDVKPGQTLLFRSFD